LGLTGHEYILDENGWRLCENPEEFSDFIEVESRRRSWFHQFTTRKGRPATMRRKTPTSLEVITTTFPPWLSDWTLASLRAGKDPRQKLGAITSRWLTLAIDLIGGERHLLGEAFHADTSDPHFDLIASRQDGLGGRIGGAGLGLAGPWTVGVDRQIRAGASIGRDKRRRFSRNCQKFQEREGPGATPLDLLLARSLDDAAAEVLGEELAPFISAYAASVPRLEREHRRAALDALDRARRMVLGQDRDAEPPEVEL
jgi:hypothetical protein